MAYDALSLTIYEPPNVDFIEEQADIGEKGREALYRYFANLGDLRIYWHPHKFGPAETANQGYTKIDISPKHFTTLSHLVERVGSLFSRPVANSRFAVTRLDVKSDIPDITPDMVLSRLFVKGIKRASMSTYKGTIYFGKNPACKVYDKLAEIRARLKKHKTVLPFEEELLETHSILTRFEVSVRYPKIDFQQFIDDPSAHAHLFDRFLFYDFEDKEEVAAFGGFHQLFSQIPAAKRKKYEMFKSAYLHESIIKNFYSSLGAWISPEKYGLPPF